MYARDEENTCYNVEMQASRRPVLGKRSRYYQSQMDMEMLQSGIDYEELPKSFVVFICDFDPFGKELYRYTFKMKCEEDVNVELEESGGSSERTGDIFGICESGFRRKSERFS